MKHTKLKGPKKALIEMKILHTFLACVLCSSSSRLLVNRAYGATVNSTTWNPFFG